ncbi:MAG TPA: ribosome biogenesis GTP-binding protein YihA/YsxC [Candidatus Kryptonia bacterium]
MKIDTAKFVTSAVDYTQVPDTDLPEVAFIGRSNVGKSSLINKLCNKKSLAQASSTPGKTRSLNFFLVNDGNYFVDLPGYGYAIAPEHMKSSWAKLVETYLQERKQLKLVIQILDARHEPMELDKIMIGWLEFYKIPYVIVMTKADKLSQNKMNTHMARAKAQLPNLKFCQCFLPFSAVSGQGRPELIKLIQDFTQSID